MTRFIFFDFDIIHTEGEKNSLLKFLTRVFARKKKITNQKLRQKIHILETIKTVALVSGLICPRITNQ